MFYFGKKDWKQEEEEGAHNLYNQAENFYFRPTRSNLLNYFDTQLKQK